MSAPLYTNVEDPVERLMLTHDALGDMKQRHRALPAELLQDANHFIPPAVFARAARATFSLATRARAGRPGTSSSRTCRGRSSPSTWRALSSSPTTRCR